MAMGGQLRSVIQMLMMVLHGGDITTDATQMQIFTRLT